MPFAAYAADIFAAFLATPRFRQILPPIPCFIFTFFAIVSLFSPRRFDYFAFAATPPERPPLSAATPRHISYAARRKHTPTLFTPPPPRHMMRRAHT